MNKLKTALVEVREDQNEESIRAALQPKVKPQMPPAKAAVANKPTEPVDETKGLQGPAAKAKPKAKAKSQGRCQRYRPREKR